MLPAAGCAGGGGIAVTSPDVGPDEGRRPADADDASALPEAWAPDGSSPEADFLLELEQEFASPECEPGQGCFLDKCDSNSQCQSAWCVEHMGEGVCSKLCQEECPEGWSCRQVGAGGPDVTYICVSSYSNLCKPCSTSEGCQAGGIAQDACLSYGSAGSFCGGDCGNAGQGCPWGFSCVDAVTVDGATLKQCVADAGVCPCTPTSIALGLATPCKNANEFGMCAGKRLCTQEGLRDCDAAVPAAEACDGADNDCDGATDEPAEVGGVYLSLCDDSNPCSQDTCSGKDGCENVLLDSGECLDGNACTIGDHCQSGKCTGTPIECDDQNPCTDDKCDGTGGCVFENNDADCGAENLCVVGKKCVEGQCSGGVEMLCGDDNPCTTDSCDPALGCLQEVNNVSCTDSDSCTVGDYCSQGKCVPGTPASCDDGDPCTNDVCLPGPGCAHEPLAGACDDGNACTSGDHCEGGKCVWTTLTACDDGNDCTDDACDPSQGCVSKLNKKPCDDGNLCTTSDYCHLGQCAGGQPLSCDDKNPCTDDSCEPKTGCQHTANKKPCSDGNPCTEGDHCTNGWCTFTKFKDCSDGLMCNGAETCDQMLGCVAGKAPVLDDKNGCTFDYCDEAKGIVHAPLDEVCDDDLFCNGVEKCDVAAGCVSGVPPSLDDGVGCTTDKCDEATDAVTHTADNSACSDKDLCTGIETCDPAKGCQKGAPLVCDDKVACTSDSCDPGKGCVFTPDDAKCDDANSCTNDSCVPETGCVYLPGPDGVPCSEVGIPGKCLTGKCQLDCLPGSKTFSFSGSPETFPMPACATQTTIEAWGGRGGDAYVGAGGAGAYVRGSFGPEIAGKTLEIRVGGQGQKGTCSLCGGGGGGGSFVWVQNAQSPLVIAAGGAGASHNGGAGEPGYATEEGGKGAYTPAPVGQGGYSDNGFGGGAGGGGGGWLSDGKGNNWATGGAAKGGAGGQSKHSDGHGAFGGGGASYHGGGGGGGYTGGSGGAPYTPGGGGGGSFNAGAAPTASSGTNNGPGKITITWK